MWSFPFLWIVLCELPLNDIFVPMIELDLL